MEQSALVLTITPQKARVIFGEKAALDHLASAYEALRALDAAILQVPPNWRRRWLQVQLEALNPEQVVAGDQEI